MTNSGSSYTLYGMSVKRPKFTRPGFDSSPAWRQKKRGGDDHNRWGGWKWKAKKKKQGTRNRHNQECTHARTHARTAHTQPLARNPLSIPQVPSRNPDSRMLRVKVATMEQKKMRHVSGWLARAGVVGGGIGA